MDFQSVQRIFTDFTQHGLESLRRMIAKAPVGVQGNKQNAVKS